MRSNEQQLREIVRPFLVVGPHKYTDRYIDRLLALTVVLRSYDRPRKTDLLILCSFFVPFLNMLCEIIRSHKDPIQNRP